MVALLVLATLTELQTGLPAGLLTAVALAETGGVSVVARGRGKGRLGCDVGVAQIHRNPCDPAEVRRLLDLQTNLTEAAKVLTWSKIRCRRSPWLRPCRFCKWAYYNSGAAERWCRTVGRRHNEIKRAVMRLQPQAALAPNGMEVPMRLIDDSTRRRLESKFWKVMGDVPVPDANQCWEWSGPKRNGYGCLKSLDIQEYAHRMSYGMFNAPIPSGLCVCHSCDNPGCVNPSHLWVGTKADNTRDMFAKGRGTKHVPTPPTGDDHWTRRHPERLLRGDAWRAACSERMMLFGEDHPLSKLSDADVDRVRSLLKSGMSQQSAACMFGVSRSTVSSIHVGTGRYKRTDA